VQCGQQKQARRLRVKELRSRACGRDSVYPNKLAGVGISPPQKGGEEIPVSGRLKKEARKEVNFGALEGMNLDTLPKGRKQNELRLCSLDGRSERRSTAKYINAS
jgi:hypothetical protein